MADPAAVVHIGENSPEQVAPKLLGVVALTEGKDVPGICAGDNKVDRKWILDTYAECLMAVKGFRSLS